MFPLLTPWGNVSPSLGEPSVRQTIVGQQTLSKISLGEVIFLLQKKCQTHEQARYCTKQTNVHDVQLNAIQSA